VECWERALVLEPFYLSTITIGGVPILVGRTAEQLYERFAPEKHGDWECWEAWE
jgi:hypothetical protein